MRPKRRNIDQLADRLATVMEWLTGQSGKIKESVTERNTVLDVIAERAISHEVRAGRERVHAENFRLHAASQLREAEELQRLAAAALTEAGNHDATATTFERTVRLLRAEAKSIRKDWHAHLKFFLQGGKYRRYSRDKVKLERRLRFKREQAERFKALKEPLTAAEISIGVTLDEKMQQEAVAK